MRELSLVEDEPTYVDNGYDPLNSAQSIIPNKRQFHQRTVAEMYEAREESREEHRRSSGLRADVLQWVDQYCHTGKFKTLKP